MNRRILLAVFAFAVAALSAAQCGAEQAKKKQGSAVLFTYDSGAQWLSWTGTAG